jgi:leucyl-tRNA synthetase
VLHPIGWDAFGLPAEQYAVKTGIHPAHHHASTTSPTSAGRCDRVGFVLRLGSREVDTTDPTYYKWTQWIFLQLHERGLAYVAEVPVNWCPELGTVLANEEVIDGKSEVGGYPVIRQSDAAVGAAHHRLRRAPARATSTLVDWPASTLEDAAATGSAAAMAPRSTSRSTASRLRKLRVFTTRPDTLFGATYMVLAPEHPLRRCTRRRRRRREAVREYQRGRPPRKSGPRAHRTDEAEDRRVHRRVTRSTRSNGEKIPVWIADYVLDELRHRRDHGRARRTTSATSSSRRSSTCPIVQVVSARRQGRCAAGRVSATTGTAVNSATPRRTVARWAADRRGPSAAITAWLEPSRRSARRRSTSSCATGSSRRQRYWGEPFPIVCATRRAATCAMRRCPKRCCPCCRRTLERLQAHRATGEPPLARASPTGSTPSPRRQVRPRDQHHAAVGRLVLVLPALPRRRRIAESSARSTEAYRRSQLDAPVDLYVGGAEHAVLHLLYARFWHKVLFDIGRRVARPSRSCKLVQPGHDPRRGQPARCASRAATS